MANELELKDVIRKLREDLQAAVEEGKDEAIKFKMESIELELKVAVKDKGAAEGGLKFYIFNFGAKAEVENEQALTIKLKMTPEKPMSLLEVTPEKQDGPLTIAGKTKERPGTPGDGGTGG